MSRLLIKFANKNKLFWTSKIHRMFSIQHLSWRLKWVMSRGNFFRRNKLSTALILIPTVRSGRKKNFIFIHTRNSIEKMCGSRQKQRRKKWIIMKGITLAVHVTNVNVACSEKITMCALLCFAHRISFYFFITFVFVFISHRFTVNKRHRRFYIEKIEQQHQIAANRFERQSHVGQ